MTVVWQKKASSATCSKRTRKAREGFAVAPVLYLLAMAGVAAGVLFSGYSQILRTNISVTNATMAKGDLTGGATTLAATSVFTNDQSVFCPPGGPGMSGDCIAANAKIKLMSFAAAEAARRPTNWDQAAGSGSPDEVGVFSAGSGIKQLDPWGRYYIYCRWEQDRNNTDQPSVAIISAGANGTLETACGDERAGGDDQFVRYNVGTAINRASVWQQAEGATEASFGPNITVTADGVIEAKGLILSDTATIVGTLNLSTPLPIGSGGTGASTQSGARMNLGSGSVGDNVFTATTTGAALTALGGTSMGQYLFAGGALVAETASAVRSNLLGVGEIGDALFLADTATEGRAALGSTAMGDYLFTSSALDGAMASTVRSTLLGASAIGDSVFTAATTELALTGLGASDIGKALFTASDEGSARTSLGAGAEGSLLFTATTQLHAWEILGLTGSLNPTLNIGVTGEAGSVNAANLTGGAVPIAHGGTSATNASAALDNLFGGDTSPTSTLNTGRIAPHSIGSGKLDDIVAAGTYNLVEVDSAGRVVSGSYIGYTPDQITDESGEGIIATPDGGGYLYFSTASVVRMTLSPLGYLGLGITQPQELLHLYGGDARISGAAETTRELQFATGTSGKRWIIGANSAPEAGASAGSNFILNRVTDGGAELTALTIDRATGNATFGGQVAATGGFLGVFTGTFTGTVVGGSMLGVSATQTAPSRNGDLTTGLFSDTAATVSISTGGVERVRVASDGSVGIGTSSPTYPLDVGGSARAHLVHFTGTTTGQGTIGGTATGSAGAIQFNDGMNALGADSDLTWGIVSKYLGIGTNAARASLDVGYRSDAIIFPSGTTAERPSGVAAVAGMIRYNESLNAFEAYQGAVPAWGALGGTATVISGVLLGENAGATNPQRSGEAGTGLFSDATGVVAISSLGTEALRVTATGSVGIGTGAPAYALDVQAGISRFLSPGGTSGVEIGAGQTANNFAFIDLVGDTTYTDYGLRLIRSNTGENANAQLINRGTGWLTLTAADAGAVAIQTNGSTRLLVTATGSVGIGTPTPAVTLDLSAKTDALRVPVGTTEQRPSLAVGLLRYNSSLATLEAYINGAWNSLLTSTSTEIGSRYLGASTAATNPAREGEVNTGLFTPATGVVGIASLGAEALRVTATGSVGIGTTTPAQALDVAGSANFSGTLGIGGAAASNTLGIYLTGTSVDTSQRGIQNVLNVTGTLSAERFSYGIVSSVVNAADNSSYANNLYGSWGQVINSAGAGYNTAFGAYNYVINNDTSLTNANSYGSYNRTTNASTGTLTNAYGMYGLAQNGGAGTVTTGFGGYSNVTNSGGGTVVGGYGHYQYLYNTTGTMTSAYGNYVRIHQNGAGGSMGTSYGYYSRLDHDAGTMGTGYLYYGVFEGTHTTKYGIYLEGETTNYLSGSLGIGTAPTYKLQVAEDSTTAASRGLHVVHTGAVSGTGYGGVFSKTGASTTNVGLYTQATGATNNYGLIVAAGRAGIGTTTPGVSLHVNATDAIQIPVGTTAQRPTAAVGQIRYNTNLSQFEGYNGSAWVALGGGTGYEKITSSCAPFVAVGASSSCTATCSSGKKIVSGSASCTAFYAYSINSQGISGDAYTISCKNNYTSAQYITMSAVATCIYE